jgi:hypothetical protein
MKRINTIFAFLAILAIITAGCSKNEKLLNGKNLSNWNFVLANESVPADEVFSVSDGILTISGKPLGYMFTKEKYGDCTLELDWRWKGEASNSGIFLLIEEPKIPFPNGIECQLKAGSAGDLVLLNGSDLAEYKLPEGVTERPMFPVIGKQNESNEKPVGEWNHAKIVFDNGVITIYINGLLQNKGTNKIKEGNIGLQSEGGQIQFRNMVISPN